jgi:alcohol-forming fatty acyl-CoA reductase
MTFKDPMPGYVDNFSTLNGFGILKILGIIHVTYHRSRYFVNIVPVDMTVNLILAATRARTNEIYNCVWQVTKKIEDHKAIFLKDIRNHPVRQMIFYPSFTYTSSIIMFKFLMLFTSYLPAIMIDTILKLKGSSTRFVKIYNKVYYYQMLYHYFTAHWHFQVDNSRRLFTDLSLEDQKEFPFDVKSDEFVDYIYNTNSSMRINYFKENEKDLIEARKKLKILKSSHHLILIAFYACLMYLIVRIMGKIFFK